MPYCDMIRRLSLSSAITRRTFTTLPATAETGSNEAFSKIDTVAASVAADTVGADGDWTTAEGHTHPTKPSRNRWRGLRRLFPRPKSPPSPSTIEAKESSATKRRQQYPRRPGAKRSGVTALVRPLGLSVSRYSPSKSPILEFYLLIRHIGWYRYHELIIAYRQRKANCKKKDEQIRKAKRSGIGDAVARFLNAAREDFKSASGSWNIMLSAESVKWQAMLSTKSDDWRGHSDAWRTLLSVVSSHWRITCSDVSSDWQRALTKRSDDWQNKLNSVMDGAMRLVISFTLVFTLTFVKIYSMTPIEDTLWVVIAGVFLPLLFRRRFLTRGGSRLPAQGRSKGACPSMNDKESGHSRPDEMATEFEDRGSETDMALDTASLMVVTMPATALLKLYSKNIFAAMIWTSVPCISLVLMKRFFPGGKSKTRRIAHPGMIGSST